MRFVTHPLTWATVWSIAGFYLAMSPHWGPYVGLAAWLGLGGAIIPHVPAWGDGTGKVPLDEMMVFVVEMIVFGSVVGGLAYLFTHALFAE